jgi:tetratricopeptide (TPR) repeat protein/putative methionine-R-sulfoxide reductase with GAF domain/CheY-like chemotaxis protein
MADRAQETVVALAIEPIIGFPAVAEAGKTYLLTVDVRPLDWGEHWPYEQREECVIYCLLDSVPLFRNEPLGEPAIVLHRFGGTYGPAKFLMHASEQPQEGSIQVSLVNDWGIPLMTLQVPNLKIQQQAIAELPRSVIRVSQTAVSPPEPERETPFSRKRILWVDDFPSNHEAERSELALEGALVTLALSTEEALHHLNVASFDAIISSLAHGEDEFAGFGLLDQVLKLPEPAPVAIYAGSRALRYERDALERGAIISTNNFNKIRKSLLEAFAEIDAGATKYLTLTQARRFIGEIQKLGLEQAIARTLLSDPYSSTWEEVWRGAKQRATTTLPEFLIRLIDQVFATDYSQLWAFEQRRLSLVSQVIGPDKAAYEAASLSGVIGRAATTKRTVYVPNVRDDPDYIPAEPTTQAELAIPIFNPGSESVVSVINIESPNHDAFTPRQVEWLEAVCRSFAGASAKGRSTGREVTLSNLPERNPFFTGREQVLTQLQEALAERGRVAVSGLGGVGKTQTALEYAHRHLAEYTHAFWATADSRDALLSSYVTIERLLELPAADIQNQMVAVEAVKRWLGAHEGWLLLLDNADDLSMARAFLPSGKNGHVLLTTRARATGVVAQLVDIEEMGTEEGALFLLRRAKHIAADAPLEAAAEADKATAKEITAQLDGLPLALDQAGAYIEETGCGLSGYLDLHGSHGLELLRRRGGLPSDHPDPVATTWALSFENIEKASPAAAELLRFCAFLHPDGIPEEVFSEGAPELGPVLGPVGSDVLALNSAISEILKYSLLRRDPTTGTLDIPRLVQAVLKRGMDESIQRLWAERAVRAVSRAFPSVEFSTWAACERVLAQAYACAELINRWGFEFTEGARLLNRASFYLSERGRYTEVEPLCGRALAIWEKALGPEDPELAQSLNILAELYRVQGQYAKAEPLYKRALSIREKALGPEDPELAWSLNNLALLYYNQGQYAKAEPLYRRALTIWEKTLGPEHRNVAQSLNNLAELYRAQGQYAKAEPLCQRALSIREKTLGPEHPDVATSLNDLAVLYVDQGRYAKAESLYKQALAIREKALGLEHPDVTWSLNSLATLYADQGQYAKAEPLYERALAIREKALGPEHPNVARSLNGLALLDAAQGQYAKAEPLYERALAIREKTLGPEHPDVATSLNDLAMFWRSQGRYAKAEPLYKRALVIREKALGPEHPDLAWSLSGLAALYAAQGQYAKAEPLYQRALAILEKALGPEHPKVAISLENYALCLRAMDRSQEAEALEARARAIRAKSA